MGPDLKNCNGCICPKRPIYNYLLLYLNLDDMISSEKFRNFDYIYLEETFQTIQTKR